ncbi:MAG: hypothetical protein ACOYMG_20100 [Candidatus Methylumidiphilus sp.]
MNVISRIGELLGGPQNMAKPPTRVAVQPQHESIGNIAGAINSGAFGPPDPNSRMDKATVRKPLPPGLLDGTPWPSPAQVKAFDADLADQGYRRPEAAVAALQKLNEPFLRLQTAIAEVTRSQAPAYRAHLEGIAARVAAGDLTVQREDCFTKIDFEEDAAERLSAFKQELRKLADRAWAVAGPVLAEKASYATARADVLDDSARQSYDHFAVPYLPPGYILLLRKYAQSLANGSRKTAGLPSAMIETV